MTEDPYGCDCFNQHWQDGVVDVRFHAEQQDTGCRGWQRVLELIEDAAAGNWEQFDPLQHMSEDERVQLVTLPPSIEQAEIS